MFCFVHVQSIPKFQFHGEPRGRSQRLECLRVGTGAATDSCLRLVDVKTNPDPVNVGVEGGMAFCWCLSGVSALSLSYVFTLTLSYVFTLNLSRVAANRMSV